MSRFAGLLRKRHVLLQDREPERIPIQVSRGWNHQVQAETDTAATPAPSEGQNVRQKDESKQKTSSHHFLPQIQHSRRVAELKTRRTTQALRLGQGLLAQLRRQDRRCRVSVAWRVPRAMVLGVE